MWIYLTMIVAFGSVFAFALILASKNGSKAAQLEAIKGELKKIAREQEKANEISNNVSSLTADDARRRLHEVANAQQRNRLQ